MRTKGSPEELERRRFRAIELLRKGHAQKKVAKMLGVSESSVSIWKKTFEQKGLDGLKARPHPGPKKKLGDRERKKLGKMLLKGPRSQGYATELWTLKRVAQLIRRKFGVQYDESGVWHVLRSMGWTCQKPERRARERDEARIETWRKKDWPRIKKSP